MFIKNDEKCAFYAVNSFKMFTKKDEKCAFYTVNSFKFCRKYANLSLGRAPHKKFLKFSHFLILVSSFCSIGSIFWLGRQPVLSNPKP